jgi:hypothetical protein
MMNNHPPPPMPPLGVYAPAAGLMSAVGAPYQRHADAVLGGRSVLEESLLFPAAGAPYPAAVPAHLQGGGDTTGGVLLEERLLRLHDAHSRVLTNEVAARALQDQVSAAQQQNNQQALQYQASAQQQQQITAQRNHDLNLANSIERIMAQQEVQVQEHRLREQLVGEQQHQQAVARAAWGGGTGGIGLGGINNLLARRATALSGDGSSYAHILQLAEAVALRERHQRALEEEAVRLQHNQELRQQMLHQQQPPQHFGAGAGSAGDAAEQQHHLQQNGGISHLLQNKHILIQLRDGLGLGVGSRVGAGIPSNDSLFERQLMDAHILLNGGGIGGGVGAGLSRFQQPGGERAAALAALACLRGRAGGDDDFINQAYLDALIARRVESARLGGQQPAVDNGNDGIHHRQAATAISAAYPPSVGGGGSGQRLRYFNNGNEVDMEGNPLPPSTDNNSGNGDGGGARGNGDSVIPSNRLPGHPLDVNANAAAPMDDNNAITHFLYAVVNRVPEIGPALAVIQREGNDPNVVDATMTVLRSILERCARATDEITLDLHRRITGWYVDSPFVILLLLSLVSLTIIHTHLQQLVYDYFINSIAEISTNSLGIMPGMNGMMVGPPHLIPPPGSPQLLRQRMSDPATHRLAFGASGVVHPHPGAYPGGMIPYPVLSHTEHLAMMHRHHQYQQAGMMAYHQPRVIHDDSNALNAGYGAQPNPSGKEALPPSEGSAKLETPVDDDVPMMAMYKSKKKADKCAKKAEKRKRKPKLVHKVTPQLKTVSADPPPKVHDAKNHLVHHNLFNGGFDGIGKKISSPLKGESIESVKEKSEDSPPSSNGMLKLSSSPNHKKNGGSVSFPLAKSELTTEENSVATKSLDEIASMIAASRKKSPPMSDDKKLAAKNEKKSSPSSKISLPVAKKHRVDSDKSSNDEDNCEKEKGNPDSGTSTNVKVTTDCKRDGPHGDVLALLFNSDGSGNLPNLTFEFDL